MKLIVRSIVLPAAVAALVPVLSALPAFAVMPEPKSAGMYEQGKGTKASEEYESLGRAGGPEYHYGRGLYWGPLHVKPGLVYTRQYDNNIFYSENGRVSDWSHIVVPTVSGEVPFGGGQHLYTTNYTLVMEEFDEQEDQNSKNHSFSNSFTLNYVPFTLSLDHNWRKTVDRSGTEFTDRIGRYEHTTHGLLEVPFSAFFLETEAINYNEDYRALSDSAFDHNVFDVYQRIGVDWRPQTQVLLEYGYEDVDYRRVTDRDGHANQFMFGMRGHLSELVLYQGWIGAQFRDYDAASREDFDGLALRGALQYDMTTTSRITLRGDRRPEESTFDNQSFYVRNRIELAWRKQLRDRLFFNTRETFQFNEYQRPTTRQGETKTREDYVWSTGLGLEYTLPNELITFYCEYRFNARDSNLAGLDYDDQVASAGVRASF